jgi:hypothetical protein
MVDETTPGSEEYVRGELLGRGLTSDLYTGQYGPGGVAVLLKRFRDHDTSDIRLNKLRWQVLWAGAKRYPGLAWTRGVHEDEDGRRTVIVEPAGDETLEEFLQRNEGGVNAGVALSLIRQLAEALQQAAELGFDYQFLQPATIMLEGETNPILLGLDLAGQFDLAALAADAPAAQVAFLSPEQRAGEESDERSLIYSLGVLLATLLAPAWLYGTDGLAADTVPEPPAEVLAALQEDVSPETFALLQVALQRNPASRHKDLSSFLQAARAAELAEAGDDDGAAAAAAGLAQPRGWKPSGVPKSVVSAGSVEMGEPVSAATATADEAPPSSPPPPDAPYRGGSRQPRLGLILLYLLLAIVAAGAILFVLEPEIIDRLRRPGVVTEGPVAPSPTVFNLGIATTPEAPATTPAPAAATATATATATAVPATASPTRATATATRPSPTAMRATATPSPSPTATAIVPPPTTVLIFPTSTPLPPPPTEPPPPPPTEPPPPPPPPPTEPPPPTPTEAPPATPTAPSP